MLTGNISYSVYTTWRKYSIMKEARFLDKLIRKGESKSLKKKFVPKSTSMNDYARRILTSPASKRLNVLNKVFMGHVADFMSTSEYNEELSRLGVQVVKAKVSPNLHILFLYWVYTKPIVNEEVSDLLQVIAGKIRFELSTLKVISQIPEVRFVKHEQETERQLIQKLLEDLSFVRENEEKELNKDENEELGCKENQVTDINTNDSLKVDRIVSKLKQNLYGLDYPKILENILQEKTKRQPNVWEREATSHISHHDCEKLQFDKKMLKRMIFKKLFEVRKQRRLNEQLMGCNDDNQNSQFTIEEDEEYSTVVEDNETYDYGDVDEEVKKILNGLSEADETTDAKGK